MTRRRPGDGSITRKHAERYGCPPAVEVAGEDGKVRKVVPHHTCKGLYRGQVRVRTGMGKTVRKDVYGRTLKEVQDGIRALHAKERAGGVVESSVTVRDWFRTDAIEQGLDNYWSEGVTVQHWKTNTRRSYRSRIDEWIIPVLGHHRLDRLTTRHVKELYAKMRRAGLTEGTVRGIHAVLHRGLKVAAREGLIPHNVVSDDCMDAPVAKPAKTICLTVEEAWAVLHAAGNNVRWYLALFLGMRQGEVLALRWSDLFLDAVDEAGDPAPYLVVRQSVAYDSEAKEFVFEDAKSEASTDRVVPLLPPVVERFRILRDRTSPGRNDLVFHNGKGRPRQAKVDHYQWKALLDLAEVREVTLHSARKTTSQLLENAGVPDRVAMEILGHSEVRMTHHYQSGNAPAKQDAMRRLAAYVEGKEPPPLRAV